MAMAGSQIRNSSRSAGMQYIPTMPAEHSRNQPSQLSFLPPEDVELLSQLRLLVAEAQRIYDARPARHPDEPFRIQSPADVHRLFGRRLESLEQEQVHTLSLNARHGVIRSHLIYQGTMKAVPIRLAEIFRPSIVDNAAGLIMVHNHPSGDPEPSREDVRLTQSAVEAGRLLDVELVDHVVIALRGFVSLRERGMGFER